MTVLLYGRFGEYPQKLEGLVKSLGLDIVDKNPEVVIALGGDGTLLGAEQAFPGIPKLPLRDSNVCFHCSRLPNDQILKHLADGKIATKEYLKLQCAFAGKTHKVLNEFVIRNKFQTTALRFKVSTSPSELIGDGIVIATPFGSTGYYFSIARQPFSSGIGLAFNNIHNLEKRSEVVPEDTVIEVEITRGPALFSADNDPKIIELTEGDKIMITKSQQSAKLLIPAV